MLDAWWWPWPAVVSAAFVVCLATVAVVARRRPGFARRTIMVAALATSLVYVVWRVGFTLPSEGGWGLAMGITLLVAEIVGLTQVVSAVVLAWRPEIPPTPPLDALGSVPSVDVYIATYDESLAILEPTLAGAMSMRYPGRVTVYLCDDGDRSSVGELARRYGAVHLTREEHAHAKAGNLNNALAHSRGELVVTLDADMIPTADFLEKTVGYFVDEKLAYAQAPQAFHNEDPFQYNLFSGAALPNEQDLFMRGMQAGKSRFNAVMYVGSNTVFRRTALESIGGFATGVITEDMATGMLLQAAGWRSVFVPHLIAAGLAPESFAALLVQRTRWSRGNIQTTRRWNPLTVPGLSAMQRWLYTDGIIYWHFGIMKLIFIVAPLFWLIAGVTVVEADLASLAVIWLPYFAASLLTMHTISGGRRSFTWTHVYEVAMAPTIALAVLAEWVGLSTKAFAVTPKGVSTSSFAFRFRIALPHLVLLGLSVGGLLNVFVLSPELFSLDSLVITVFWVTYNMVGLVFAVLVCLERPRPRRQERTAVDTPVVATLWPGVTVPGRALDLSVGGARILLPWSAHFTADVAAQQTAETPVVSVESTGEIAGLVRWVTASSDGLLVGFEFAGLTATQMIGVVGVITQSPHWIGSDLERDASLRRSLRRTVAGVSGPRQRHARSQLRLSAGVTGRIHRRSAAPRHAQGVEGSWASHRVVVEDVSAGGCRISALVALRVGESISVELPFAPDVAVPAVVRWVERRRGKTLAGLQFSSEGRPDVLGPMAPRHPAESTRSDETTVTT